MLLRCDFFEEMPYCFPQLDAPLTVPPVMREFRFLRIHTNTCFPVFCITAILMEVASPCGLFYMSLMISDADHFFMGLMAVVYLL